MEMAVILNLVFIFLTPLIVTNEANVFASRNSRTSASLRSRPIPRSFPVRTSDLRSAISRNTNLRVRAPSITLRELIAILQARRIRKNMRRTSSVSRSRNTNVQPSVTGLSRAGISRSGLSSTGLSNTRLPSSVLSPPQQVLPQVTNTQSTVQQNTGVDMTNALQQEFTRQLLLSSLFGNDGKFINNPIARSIGFVDPRPHISNHHKDQPPVQIKSKKADISPLVIETAGNIKVSEIKNAQGQTQFVIDTTGNKKVPPAVTLKPGEDPPETEFKFPF